MDYVLNEVERERHKHLLSTYHVPGPDIDTGTGGIFSFDIGILYTIVNKVVLIFLFVNNLAKISLIPQDNIGPPQ